MAGNTKRMVDALLERWGTTYSEAAGFDPADNTPAPLFRLLVLSLLISARIRAAVAVAAARALAEAGWTTPDTMAASDWADRARVLNEAGYARYDERTSTMLADSTELLRERWGGDLRRLREEAGRDPDREHRLLTEFKGIGDVGADVFCREVQGAWDELYPFADDRVLGTARELGLPADATGLAELASRQDFPRLVAALVRVGLERDPRASVEQAMAGP